MLAINGGRFGSCAMAPRWRIIAGATRSPCSEHPLLSQIEKLIPDNQVICQSGKPHAFIRVAHAFLEGIAWSIVCSGGLSAADIAEIVTAANERVGDFDYPPRAHALHVRVQRLYTKELHAFHVECYTPVTRSLHGALHAVTGWHRPFIHGLTMTSVGARPRSTQPAAS